MTLGCVVAADTLNPAFFSAMGFDPGTIFPSQGTVIVSFTNPTDYTVTFHAFESADPDDLSADSRNFSVVVPPNSSRNEVLSCPVGLVSTGVLDESYEWDGSQAAEIVTGEETIDVEYAWPLREGDAFSCGDVIDFRLESGYVGEDLQYIITVRIIPGR
jgi:hypothetical protein